MTALIAIVMLAVGVSGTAVVLVRDPLRQIIAMAPFGIAIVFLLAVFQAPDVVLSAVVVGVFAYPVMVALTISKIRGLKR